MEDPNADLERNSRTSEVGVIKTPLRSPLVALGSATRRILDKAPKNKSLRRMKRDRSNAEDEEGQVKCSKVIGFNPNSEI